MAGRILSNLFGRSAAKVAEELITKPLAESPAFQRMAVRAHEEMSLAKKELLDGTVGSSKSAIEAPARVLGEKMAEVSIAMGEELRVAADRVASAATAAKRKP
eukprot:PLAT11908.1.p2 GENE.PLAT11908.1~~PLAT11908.1.p2  ORF type:complete len:114 (-),score=27.13 PLAT11908.1:35-343(-)